MSSILNCTTWVSELGTCQSNVCYSWAYERLQKSKDSLKNCFENVNMRFKCSDTCKMCETYSKSTFTHALVSYPFLNERENPLNHSWEGERERERDRQTDGRTERERGKERERLREKIEFNHQIESFTYDRKPKLLNCAFITAFTASFASSSCFLKHLK